MTFLYTARSVFSSTCDPCGLSWQRYIDWSKLAHLTEVVSLDRMLNVILAEPDYDNADDWNFIHTDGKYITGFFTSPDYVLKKLSAVNRFNFLAVVPEPDKDCRDIKIDGYTFVGYDLLDKEFGNSALSNCGGFDNSFLPSDLNDKGLIDDFEKAYHIKKELSKNNPGEHHADTNVIAVWRHNTIGRVNS